MNWNREKTQHIVFVALAVLIAASASAGPTFFGGPNNNQPGTFVGSGSSFFGTYSFGGDGPSRDGRGDRSGQPSGDWNFPTGGDFDGDSGRNRRGGGDWDGNWDGNFVGPRERDHCGDWNGHATAVPAPGSILLASIGLGIVGTIRKRKLG